MEDQKLALRTFTTADADFDVFMAVEGSNWRDHIPRNNCLEHGGKDVKLSHRFMMPEGVEIDVETCCDRYLDSIIPEFRAFLK